MPYTPIDYWSRLHERDDLSSVGQSGLPAGLNRWLYRVLERNVRSFLRRHGLMRPFPQSAFDVGAGIGFWVDVWHRCGASKVDGCDLVPDAVVRLNDRYGAGGAFVIADVSLPGQLPDRRYPFVSCMNVLLHITDDAAFDRALVAIADLVAPGGVLLLAEPIVGEATTLPAYDPERHSRARHLEAYAGPFTGAGLELVDHAAATVLANNPIEAGSPGAYRRYVRWWRFVAGRAKRNPASARWLGPLIDVADRIAMPTGAAPSTKLVLFRRPGS
jgi:SAM-dependent methyltransferase